MVLKVNEGSEVSAKPRFSSLSYKLVTSSSVVTYHLLKVFIFGLFAIDGSKIPQIHRKVVIEILH